jgi:membrane protein required for colicin V production
MFNLDIITYNYIFFAIIIISLIISLFRGGIKEISSIITWISAFILTKHYANLITPYITKFISNEILKIIVIFAIIFIIVAILMIIANKILKSLLSSVGLGGIDYLIAVIFGTIRGVIICAILVFIIESLHLDDEHNWQKTKISPLIKPILNLILSSVPKVQDIEKLPNKLNF